ncbi:MAG: DUF4837 family protein, partial [Planctomycetes bacterium]|nr:DUF4837 family protein [Planctomycetota bacterium]
MSADRDPGRIDAAIVGGGAAGLACGIFAARRAPALTIVVLDGARKLGAKILVSGGGRCNVTNRVVTAAGDRLYSGGCLRGGTWTNSCGSTSRDGCRSRFDLQPSRRNARPSPVVGHVEGVGPPRLAHQSGCADMRKYPLLLSALVATTLVSSACDKPRAWGEWNSIIAGVSNERWSDIEDVVYSALEPRIFTIRNEKMFRVTQQDPREEDWRQLKRFRQLLVIGSVDDPWVAEALEGLDRDTFNPPELLHAENVWAKGQRVSIILLEPTGGVEEVTTLLDPLYETLDAQYRRWVVQRMFMTPPDTALADSLTAEAGFTLLVPEVYYWRRADSVYVFRNDNPDPADLIRQVTVTWHNTDLSEVGEQEMV